MVVQTYNAEIVKITQETPHVRTYTLDLKGEISFLPGQFIIVEWATKLPGIKRAYSISSSPTQTKQITITLKKEGQFTTKMFEEAKIGETLLVKGPIGLFTLDDKETQDIIFLAGGTGIAPFRSMIYYVLEKKMPNKMMLFYSCRTPDEFIFYTELQTLKTKYPQFSSVFTATRCTDQSWKGFCERINPDMIKKNVTNYQNCIYYICGPMEMVSSLQTMLGEVGIDDKKIKVEKWG